jgi:hypothetical protein
MGVVNLRLHILALPPWAGRPADAMRDFVRVRTWSEEKDWFESTARKI